MRLIPMRYKSYTWPHNPHTYSIAFQRKVVEHKVPFGRHYLQDLGMAGRVLTGEGEFAGEGAYDQLKELATVFYENTPGILVHPVWQTSNAYFTKLELVQKPLPDYVRYRFEFRELFDAYQEGLEPVSVQTESRQETVSGQIYQVVQGDNLWAIAQRQGVSVEDILKANPELKNPNLIFVGQKVVIPG